MITSYKDNVMAEARKQAAGLVEEFCSGMADHARDLSPVAAVNGGNNRDSINYESSGLEGRVFTESGYGGWLEIGTSRMAARPYFRPAFEQQKRESK
jgi:HK97 gp10 family phage protein